MIFWHTTTMIFSIKGKVMDASLFFTTKIRQKNVMNIQLTDSILEGLKDGNHKAYEGIFMTYFPKVKYYIKGFVKSIDIAEELTQHVFLKIWENRQSLVISVKGFESYVFTIAYRQTIDYIRSKQVRESFYNDQMILEPDTVCIEDEYIAEETILLVEMAIENMPEKRKKIYKLSRNDGVSNDKIAEQLDVSKRTVENHLSFAMKKIRDIIGSFS